MSARWVRPSLPPSAVVGQFKATLTIERSMLSATLLKTHSELGIPAGYGDDLGLPLFAEATKLVDVGPNLVGRMQRLTPDAAARWAEMVEAARAEGQTLLIVSGYRSIEYQAALIQKKLDGGQPIEDVLKVNAAPGFSQHHTGTAVDIASPGSRPLTEDFEDSEAFAWLARRAAEFGFGMTYPRNNKYGFVYEPWHWALTAES